MTNSPYRSSDFLRSGDVSIDYEDLDYTNKLKIKALEGLDSLAASLNAISNIKAIEFQINHLNEMSTGFTEQLTAKDAQIAQLNERLNNIETEHNNELETVRYQAQLAAENQLAAMQALQDQATAQAALHEAEIAALKAANESLTENFNKFKSVLTSIDQMTDEVIS